MWGMFNGIEPLGAWICAIIFSVLLLQILLHPLRINHDGIGLGLEILLAMICCFGTTPGASKLVTTMLLLALISSFGSTLIFLFTPVVFAAKEMTSGPAPKVSSAEWVIVIFACVLFVAMLNALGFSNMQTNSVVALPMLALIFRRGFARLDANEVPPGRTRSLFLAVYPFMVFGVIYSSIKVFEYASARRVTKPLNIEMLIVFGVVTIIGTCLAWAARSAALEFACQSEVDGSK